MDFLKVTGGRVLKSPRAFETEEKDIVVLERRKEVHAKEWIACMRSKTINIKLYRRAKE
jgi:hypothetical protein